MVLVPYHDFITGSEIHSVVDDCVGVGAISLECNQFWFYVQLRSYESSCCLDGVHERLDSLLDRDVSIPIQGHHVHEQLNWTEGDRQVSSVDRNCISEVIEIEQAAHKLPELVLIAAVDDGADYLIKSFLEGNKVITAYEPVGTIQEDHLEGRAILSGDRLVHG